MKISARLTLGFLCLSTLVAIVSVLAIFDLKKLQEPLINDIPKGLHEIEQTSKLDNLISDIRYFNQVLTESSKNYVNSQKDGWRKLYFRFLPQMKSAVHETVNQGDSSDREIFVRIKEASVTVEEVEKKAILATDRGQWDRAKHLLENENYWQSKDTISKGLRAYSEKRGKKLGEKLDITATQVRKVVENTVSLLELSLSKLLLISVIGVALAIGLGFFVSMSIVKPLTELQKGARLIGKGVLDYRIPVRSKDEIAVLSEAFNEMTVKLKESYDGLEEKVKVKTKELSHKVVEIEKVNQDLGVAKKNVEKEKVAYEALLTSIGEGMIAADRNGRIVIMNQQAENMLGMKSLDVVGKKVFECVTCVDDGECDVAPERRPVYQALQSGRKAISNAFYVHKDMGKFPVAVTVSPIIMGGRTIGAIEIFRDITKEKEVDKMKTEFISTVSHELRTPMTVIREGLALVLDDSLGSINGDQREALGLSLESIDRLRRIIDNLLDISKIEAGRLEIKMNMVDFVSVAKQVEKTFENRVGDLGLKLLTTTSHKSIEAHADRDKIIQVFVNVIGNALKFTEKGGIEISVTDTGESIVCAIQDTGKGISKEDIPQVFGKFKQFGQTSKTGEKGTGLGLSIAKGIVELHRGQIWVESEPGKGTRFAFRIPKYKTFELVKEYVSGSVKDASRYGTIFSVLHLRVTDFDALRKKYGQPKITGIIQQAERLMKKGLRRQVDMTVKDMTSLYMILPTAGKEDAKNIYERALPYFSDYLAKEGLTKDVRLDCRIACYPEDGVSPEELLLRVV